MHQDPPDGNRKFKTLLTVIGKVDVEVLGRAEARPDLLQLARLGGDLPLVYLFGHFVCQLCIVRRI